MEPDIHLLSDEEEDSPLPRVLSVQSHVVSGYVGNRAAVFPLQLLGFDVDFVNSVQFSNHTKYKNMKGSVLSGDDLNELTVGLAQNELLQYDYLLTGYIGSESFLVSVLDLLTDIEKVHPSTKYICDPVLGDNGKYYVPPELVSIYQTKVLPRAYMITPNQFEAELLSGISISSEKTALAAIWRLMELGPKIVVLTSAEFEGAPGTLHCYAARCVSGGANGGSAFEVSRVVVAKQDAHFTGTGDCTAALLLAWTHNLREDSLGTALRNSLATVQSIIALVSRKQKLLLKEYTPSDSNDCRLMRAVEFSVVQGKKYIESPRTAGYVVDTWVETGGQLP